MIREMHSEDMKRVSEIWLEDSIRLHAFFPEAERIWRQRLPHFLLETRTAIGYVCEAVGAVNGFITMRGSDHYVYSVYVDFCLRGHGIGRDLLDHAKTLTNHLHLHVYEKDVDAIRFYEKQGFITVGRRREPEKETGELKSYMRWERKREAGNSGDASGPGPT